MKVFISFVLSAFLFLSYSSVAESPKPTDMAAMSGKNLDWKSVEDLIKEQKMQAAHDKALEILQKGRSVKSELLITQALIKITQLRLALHGYETAVKFLKEQDWPKSSSYQTLLHLYYARSLMTYQSAYSWEIAKREKKTSKDKLDIKSWTTEEIGQEISKSFDAAVNKNESLDELLPVFYTDYFSKNTYPKSVRPNLRDAVVYLAIDHLSNQQFWHPKQSNEIYKQNLNQLLDYHGPRMSAADENAHPLLKISSWLKDLEHSHLKKKENEAALEAQYQLLERLHQSFTDKSDKEKIFLKLKEIQKKNVQWSWWSRGQYLLAEWLQSSEEEESLIKARAEAQAGQKAYPNSVGAQMCASMIYNIEMPSYSINAMKSDAAQKRSILVNYKNFNKLHWRAYAISKNKFLDEKRNYQTEMLDYAETMKLLDSSSKPVAQWVSNFPETKDYKEHRAFVTPQFLKPGFYIVISSMKENFSKDKNQIYGFSTLVTQLALTHKILDNQKLEVKAYDGLNGQPQAEVKVTLFKYEWEKKPVAVEVKNTNAEGFVEFSPVKEARGNYFIWGEHKESVASISEGIYFGSKSDPAPIKSVLIYTDRSIYRPEQKIFFKAVGYQGSSQKGNFNTLKAGESITLSLVDPNGQEITKKTLKLGSYGTASGEFIIPKGRPLGKWFVRSVIPYNHGAQLSVEEYKRPTFEVKLQEAKESLRLNQKAKISGEARYYFGQALTSGQVKWSVQREVVFPWWWRFWGWRFNYQNMQPEIVAKGETRLGKDGYFEFNFLPEADKRNKKEVTYRFLVTAEILSEDGETRRDSHSYRLGWVAVEAQIEWDKNFFQRDSTEKISVYLKDLDGKAQKGTGSYQIAYLNQPKETLVPADLHLVKEKNNYTLPDDLKKARWETDTEWSQLTHEWSPAEIIKKGNLSHNEKGLAEIEIGSLNKSGIYRIIYNTKDRFGSDFSISRDFIVADKKTDIHLPMIVESEKNSYQVGEKAKLYVHSGLSKQVFNIEIYQNSQLLKRQKFISGESHEVIEFPVTEESRGGFTVVVSGLRDFQWMEKEVIFAVPWDNKDLKLEFSTFRDQLRPGQKEIFKISVKDDKGKALSQGVAEVLSYMYDRSLDLFVTHNFSSIASIYPVQTAYVKETTSLGVRSGQYLLSNWESGPLFPYLQPDQLKFEDGYAVGGIGRGYRSGVKGEMMMAAQIAESIPTEGKGNFSKIAASESMQDAAKALAASPAPEAKKDEIEMRSDFSEQAFFLPHLVTDQSGMVSAEFTAPDSVTSWKVLAHAITQDFRGGSVIKETRTIKELMIRTAAPRFLREGDQGEIKVTVNNASERELNGNLEFDIEDINTGKSVLPLFKLKSEAKRSFQVKKDESITLGFLIEAPKNVGSYAFKVVGKSGNYSDGERRPFPVLPSRMHLAQSRFVTLHQKDKKILEFKDLINSQDASLLNEKMVVTIDTQLFYGVLQSLPYLINYPYECTEQVLNSFVSTGILSSLFDKYPSVAQMAKNFSQRKTQLEKFSEPDANQRMTLEETPWLQEAQGGRAKEDEVLKILSPEVSKEQRNQALEKLRKMQLPSGGFPWFRGGPADRYMTLYFLLGMSRALEFKVDVPKEIIVKAWGFVHEWFVADLNIMMKENCCWEITSLVSFVLSSYPDDSWTGGAFDQALRERLLKHSFSNWKKHSPLSKAYLAMALQRKNRLQDAKLIWESVMDSAKHDNELGTYWAPEDRAWLWYNDTIETHAFALRTQMELDQKDKHNEGLVQWLFLNKKLNHWKSTRATAEVIYSLARYLDQTSQLGVRESIDVKVGNQSTHFDFDPKAYTGKKNQIVILDEKVNSSTGQITVEKSTPGIAFASATWHFSTDKMPKQSKGDFFSVERKYFKRELSGSKWILKPLTEKETLKVGDQIEVQISLRTKHQAEYVHLRDPRGAGFEPETVNSGYKWDLGINWYEETRDSASNFFFTQLPVGEYTFKYRLRANMAGTFRVGPATVQSIYAPEFNAYSAGDILKVSP